MIQRKQNVSLTVSADITSIIKCKVSEWIASQAAFIQALFRDISWESRVHYIKIYIYTQNRNEY